MSKSFLAVKNLEAKINTMLSGRLGEEVASFYLNRFNIPRKVTLQYLKQRIASNYSVKLSRFEGALSLPFLIVSVIRYVGLLLLIFMFSEKKNTKRQKFSLLIDDIQHQNEMDRWQQLEAEFGAQKTVYIAKSTNIESANSTIIYQKVLKGYDREFIVNNSLDFIGGDLAFLVWYSFKLKINLVHLHSFFLNDYLYYHSLFKSFSAKYMIQDRNLGRTNALKNYLFKQSGGIASSCIQKNIVQHDGLALFYDVEIFFSYGDKTLDDILSLGGRIDHACPVGSFAMEKSLLKLDKFNLKRSPDIDVFYIGINAITSSRTDWSGYYKSIAWLAQLASDSGNLRIVIKHHPSWVSDEKEFEIINGSGIEYLDKNVDSYECAYRSNFVITYGSSMGYELTGDGLNVTFLDPDDNNPFINQFVHIDDNVVNSYDDLKLLILGSRSAKPNPKMIMNSDYCYGASGVSRRIYEYLNSYELKTATKDLT